MSISATQVTSVSMRLREIAAEDPNRTAIEVDRREMTYAQLNEQADRLAQRLIAEVNGTEGRIALRLQGTFELAVGYMAVRRAGMTAVTVDPSAPTRRLEAIVADVEPALTLSDVDGDQALGLPMPVAHPLTFGAHMPPDPVDRERGEVASIVYTSGSTGAPKGIMLGRDQMASLLSGLSAYDASAETRVGAVVAGTVSFVEQLVAAAVYLRSTLVAYEIRRHGLNGLASWIADSQITAFPIVPTVLRHLLATLGPDEQWPSVQSVTTTGETLTWRDVAALRRHLPPEATIVNSFGLTETSGIARFEITSEMPLGIGPVPAGKILPDVQVEIVDPQGHPLPEGEAGEIVVRSATLSLGYWRRPDMTRATFGELPDGRRQVRTGDGGRLLPGGMLEHLGRLDHLVKISANRVELAEVEHALVQLETVDAAAAAPYTDSIGNTRLAACVVAAHGAQIDPRTVRAALARVLAGYMVPDRIAVVDALPRLSGGKVDRSEVAKLGEAQPEAARPTEAIGSLESSLADIWREILQVEHVDRNDDFFDLGGDSMQAARMFVEIARRLGFDRPVSMLAEAPTLASLALMLTDEDSGWDSLLAFRMEGDRPPLFVIHDGEGSLLNARKLPSELGPDQPIYGVRCQGLSGRPPDASSIQELAASYVDKIQALYPSGPYLLYGVSLGGMLAMEMARQLVRAAQDVPLVVMGDTGLAGGGPWILRHIPSPRLAAHARQMYELDAGQRIDHLLALARRVAGRHVGSQVSAAAAESLMVEKAIRTGERVPPANRVGYVRQVYGMMALNYRPTPPYPDRVVLLRAGGAGRSPDRGWASVLGDRLEIVDVPGSHSDLGREASASYVGPLLGSALSGPVA